MTYYRIAIQTMQAPAWRWITTKLTSLHAVLHYLLLYRYPPEVRLRVFFASSLEALDAMLTLENEGKASASVPAEQVLSGKRVQTAEMMAGAAASETRNQERQQASTVAVSVVPAKYEGIPDALDRRRLEMELGAGGDHDARYVFAFPSTLPESMAWMRLRARVQRGDLQP